MAYFRNKNNSRLLLLIILISLPVLAQDVVFTDGFENHPPVIVSSPVTTGAVGDAYDYDADATDVDGDTLYYQLTTVPGGMKINAVTGEIAWTPGSEGDYAVEIQVADGKGGMATQSWSILVSAGQDSDVDGLSDFEELALGTDPNDPDSDDDGVKDGPEVHNHKTDPLDPDSDSDSLTDGDEVNTHGTKPTEIDTDGDHFGDGLELIVGTDPLNPEDFPAGPPDPESMATPHDPTVTTTLDDSVSFIYEGNPPIQTGMAEGTIDPLRVAVVSGLVTARDGTPLPGVNITINHHSEYGQTQSRVDGKFNLVVNGGGFITVNYQMSGFLPVQRQVNSPWQDYLSVPDVVMVPLDSQVTIVDLSLGSTLMAQGSTSDDADGQRHAAVVFPAGTTAELVQEDGGTQAVSNLSIRATEYTVGENGPDAMPGMLPPSSGYTYAVELTADEALAEGVTSINFDQPVFSYVENFLGFPVGSIVPSGYYDKEESAWVPAENGLVIKVIGITDGLVDVDVDGDDVADNGTALSDIGLTDAERQSLAASYTAGQSLWRVPLTHFTAFDYNWPWGPPFDAFPPRIFQVVEKAPEVECGANQVSSSIIECQNLVVGERIPISGTPFTLNYRSAYVPGRKTGRTLDINLSGESIPASLKKIILSLSVAGQDYRRAFSAQPNQKTTFTWNGKDAFQRNVSGRQTVTGTIGYVYDAVYYSVAEAERAFRQFGQEPLFKARQEIVMYQPFRAYVGEFDVSSQGLGGWLLDVHRAYDPVGKVMVSGSGSTRGTSSGQQGVITRVAGGDGSSAQEGYSGDNIPAFGAWLDQPSDVFALPDGGFLIADRGNHRVRSVSADGIISTIAGDGSEVFSGDGGLATLAGIRYPSHVAMGPNGGIYVATFSSRIRKITQDGIINTIAGTGVSGHSGDGGPAIDAQIGIPMGVVIAADGSIYFSEGNRIRKIDPDGIINTIAGTGFPRSSGDGGPAIDAEIESVQDLTLGPDGTIFLAEGKRVRLITQDGIINTIAGSAIDGYSGDGGPAYLAELSSIEGLAVGKDALYISCGWPGVVRKVTSDGIITTVVGPGTVEDSYGDGGPALAASFDSMGSLSIDAHERLYIVESHDDQIRRVEGVMPGFSTGDIGIASHSGGEYYQFDANGKHQRTYNSLTGSVLYDFAYDATGLLETVTDGDGLVTTIQRDVVGSPSGILSPFGQVTSISVDTNGYINGITNPANEKFQIKSSPGGLITQTTDSRGRISSYNYDNIGLLKSQSDNTNFSQDFVRTKSATGFQVTRTTGLARSVDYDVQYPSGGKQINTRTAPDGSQASNVYNISAGSVNTVTATGMTSEIKKGPGSRFGMQAPIVESVEVTMPGGLVFTASNTSEAILSVPTDPFSVVSLSSTNTIDGRTSTSVFTGASRTRVSSSPNGRVSTITYDDQARITSFKYADFATTSALYNDNGQLDALVIGSGAASRSADLSYGPNGFIETVVDPMGRTLGFERDEVGRSTVKTLPGGVEIRFTFNAAGDMTSLTPPGKPAHNFTYDLNGNTASIVPPVVADSGPTLFSYNDDRELIRIDKPGNQGIRFNYDPEGRIDELNTIKNGVDEASYEYSYLVARQVKSVVGPGTQSLDYTYQGDLVTGATWSGGVTGSVSQSFDNSFRVSSQTINAEPAVVFSYNDDGLLTGSGDLSISRNPVNGFADSTILGVVTDSQTYSEFAEQDVYSASVSEVEVYRAEYIRDKLGRVVTKVETIEGATSSFDYHYGPQGQLTDVKRDNIIVESYAYDDNGNRISSSKNSVEMIATFDDQDRLLTFAENTYEYTPTGHLLSRTEPGDQITTYEYDTIGNLLSVTLPDSTEVAYGVDGLHRRVQREIDGSVSNQFLYAGIRPLAQLDELGNIVSIFVYTEDSTPAYLSREGINYRIISDQVGSVRLVVNASSGAVVQRLDYDSFGNVTLDSNPGFQPFGFAGGMYDHLTGLVRFGYRDYDPQIGRWTAKDPIGFGGLDTNLYRYVSNQPVNLRDISGTLVAPQWLKDIFDAFDEHFGDTDAGKSLKRTKAPILKADEWIDKSQEIADEGLRLRDVYDDPSLLDGLKGVEFFGCFMDLVDEWLPGQNDLIGLPSVPGFLDDWVELGANQITKGKNRYPDQDGNISDTFRERKDPLYDN